ncbi:hypothetical protein HOLleu_00923 [Holothuria leucospilota]|uniref:Uncharacterized protein n=1 Tax=Holothuria leucospilota TaxID=206669 RepID=A0A9Q1CPA0_HOLLE|nr:hypothetical protein HOLleu_00923 [Holothuria leucospilota]
MRDFLHGIFTVFKLDLTVCKRGRQAGNTVGTFHNPKPTGAQPWSDLLGFGDRHPASRGMSNNDLMCAFYRRQSRTNYSPNTTSSPHLDAV